MGQEPLEQRELRSRPAIRADAVANGPGDVTASRPVQTRYQALVSVVSAQPLIIGARGFQLLSGVQVGEGDHVAVGQLQETQRAFIARLVHFEPLAFQGFVALPPPVDPDEVGLGIVRRAFADR